MDYTQRYTFYCWLDADNVIRRSGFCPTADLGEYPNWQRPGLRYVESNLNEITSEGTHYFDAADGTFKRRARPDGDAQQVVNVAPFPSRRKRHHGNH
jgi:hypothetical protein